MAGKVNAWTLNVVWFGVELKSTTSGKRHGVTASDELDSHQTENNSPKIALITDSQTVSQSGKLLGCSL